MSRDVHQLLTTIEGGSREETWEAAKELSSLGSDIILHLISLLTKGRRTDTRAAAAYVLGANRHEPARASLEGVLSNPEEESSIRSHAAEALGYIQNRESLGVLLNQLKDKDQAVRYWCIFALGQIGDPQAIPQLKQVAESVEDQFYEDHSLRAEAIDAIAEIEQRGK
jgi:HEAT repeat protein